MLNALKPEIVSRKQRIANHKFMDLACRSFAFM